MVLPPKYSSTDSSLLPKIGGYSQQTALQNLCNFQSNSVCDFLESQREVAYSIHTILAPMRHLIQPSTSIPSPPVIFMGWTPKELFIVLTAKLAYRAISL